MTLVPLAASHLDAVAALEARAGDVRWTRAQFARELELPMSCFRVGFENETLVGYGGFWSVAGEAQITNLVIDPACRRRGFGEHMVEALLVEARKQRCTRATLEVREKNPAALALYRKMGFQKVGKRLNAYENPADAAILMEKKL